MKKILSILFIALYVLPGFSNEYDDLLAKGKDFESKQQYVYALGYYYDAMQKDDSTTEANKLFNSLENKLRQGASGLKLSKWDDPKEAWKNIIKEFYKYFTEFSPYEFHYFDELEQGELNYKNRTASYSMKYNISLTNKFMILSKCLTQTEVWDNDDKVHFYYLSECPIICNSYTTYGGDRYYIKEPETIPEQEERKNAQLIPYTNFYFSPFKEVDIKKIQDIGIAFQNEVKRAGINTYTPTVEDFEAAFKIEQKYDVQKNKIIQECENKLHSELLNFYKQTGIALSVPATRYSWSIDCLTKPNVLASFASFEDSYNFVMFGKYLPYDLQFGIYDKDNKLLLAGARQCAYSPKDLNDKCIYSFSNVPESIIELIEKKEYSIKPITAYLNFGAFRTYGYKENASYQEIRNSYLKNASEIKLDLRKIGIINNSEIEEKAKKEINYSSNYNSLKKLISYYIDNSNKLGLKADHNLNVVYVEKKSPAQKAGIKYNDKIEFPYSEFDFDNFSPEYIINNTDLKQKLKIEEIPEEELKSYIKQTLNNEKHIIKNGYTYCIVPLETGEEISITICKDKSKKNVKLIVPNY